MGPQKTPNTKAILSKKNKASQEQWLTSVILDTGFDASLANSSRDPNSIKS
jgi:hypothetical protein